MTEASNKEGILDPVIEDIPQPRRGKGRGRGREW